MRRLSQCHRAVLFLAAQTGSRDSSRPSSGHSTPRMNVTSLPPGYMGNNNDGNDITVEGESFSSLEIFLIISSLSSFTLLSVCIYSYYSLLLSIISFSAEKENLLNNQVLLKLVIISSASYDLNV